VRTGLIKRIEFFLSRELPGRSTQASAGLALGTLKGPVREDNQDRAAVAALALPSGKTFLIALVCDGMGGMAAGGEAASCAASSFIGKFTTDSRLSIREMLYEAVSAANEEVYSRFRGNGGTTLTAIVATGMKEAWAVHVGDSRLYECTAFDGLSLITRDDTIGGQLKHPSGADEDILDNRLLQFVGVGSTIEPHIFRLPKGMEPTYLLTSDGAHSIGRKTLDGIAKRSRSPAELVRKVVYVAEAIGVEDNSTAVSIMGSEVSWTPKFNEGVELTLWGLSDKLEMWLDGPQAPQPAALEAPKEAKPDITTDKPKKPARVRQRTNKKTDSKPVKEPVEEVVAKPQLHIEFGSQDNDES
jgi:serine/threonine protein phosphatase PrpC